MQRRSFFLLFFFVITFTVVILGFTTSSPLRAQGTPSPTPANLQINKTGSPNPLTAGHPLTYTIVVTNSGPAAAQNVVIHDVLPTGVIFNGAWHMEMLGGMGGNVVVSSKRLTGTIDTLYVGGRITITAQTLVDTNTSGSSIVNTASVSSTTNLVSGSHTASVTTNVITAPTPTPTPNVADLHISKSSSTSAVAAGQPLTYTIVVTNAGPSTAQNVLIKDVLPSGVQFNGPSSIHAQNGINPNLLLASNTLTGTVGTLNVGGVVTITGHTLVSANATGSSLVNTASVTTTNDANPANNTASVTTNLLTPTPTPNSADLRISKTSAPNPVAPGQVLTYTIIVTNTGPSAAQNIIVKDLLPAGVSFNGTSHVRLVNGTQANLLLSSGALTGTVATLNPGGVFTIWGRTLVSVNATGASLLNTASVTTTNDLNPANNSASATTALLTATPTSTATSTPTNTPTFTSTATPTLTATATQTPVATATNPALSTATLTPFPTNTATPTDTATVVPGTPTPTDTPTSLPTPTNAPSVTATSTPVPATFTPTNTPVPFTATPTNTAATNTSTATATQTATVTQTPTTTPTNTATPVPTTADLRISKTSAPNPVVAGQPLTYTIVVTNAGPSVAQNVVIKDVLPAGVSFDGTSRISVNNGINSNLLLTSNALTGTVGTLNVGGVVTILGRALVSANATGPALLNTASVTVTNDVILANNSAQASTTLITATPPNTPTPTNTLTPTPTKTATPTATPTSTATFTPTPIPNIADLQIRKTGAPNPVKAGDPLVYTIVITNAGPGTAQNLVIKDVLPAGVSFAGASSIRVSNGLDGRLILNSSTLTGTVATLNASGVVTITLQTVVASNATGNTLQNTASVTTTNDTVPGNNTATALISLLGATPTGTPVNTPTATPSTTQTPPPTATVTPTPAQANLHISIYSDPQEIIAGQMVTYTILVTNTGGSPAKNIVVKDTLPQGVTPEGPMFFHMQNGTGGNVVSSNGSVTATVTTLGPGGIIQIKVPVRVNSNLTEAALTNKVQVNGDGGDLPLDELASVTTPLLGSPNRQQPIFLPFVIRS